MHAQYTGKAFGMWKGLALEPGKVFDIPEALQEIVGRHPEFKVCAEGEPDVKRGRGRPRKAQDDDAA